MLGIVQRLGLVVGLERGSGGNAAEAVTGIAMGMGQRL